MSLFLILLAAGDSKRLNSNIPKPFHTINDKTLLEHTINAFKDFKEIKKVIIVYNKKHKRYLNKLNLDNIIKIQGGNNRQESSFKALKAIRNMKCKQIIIHDAARPNPSKSLIKKLILKLKKGVPVIPIIDINDATKIFKKNNIIGNINRTNLKLAQTPQGFSYKKIYLKHYKNKNKEYDDDSAMFTNDGEKILTISGSKDNIKITDREDLNNFKKIKRGRTYYGLGFDVHRLEKKRKLYLGGIKIPFKLGLKGHSDADPVLHSLIDSLLGACKLGDIGKFFSDKNKKYKNIRSTKLLKKIIEITKSKNFSINNIDINIIAQEPKIKKYSNKMKKVIGKICKISSSKINIKGKTTEKLGLIGKEKAVAAESIISVTNHD